LIREYQQRQQQLQQQRQQQQLLLQMKQLTADMGNEFWTCVLPEERLKATTPARSKEKAESQR